MLEGTKDELKRNENKKSLINISLDNLEKESAGNEHEISDHILNANEAFKSYKKEYIESAKVIDPEIEPISSRIITTATLSNIVDMKNMLSKGDFSLDLFENLKNSVSDVQTIVAVGPYAKQVKIGDVVKIELKDFTIMENPGTINRKEVFSLPLDVINGRKYLAMHENNIKFIYKSKKGE